MTLHDLAAARHFPQRQRALDLIAQIAAAPGSPSATSTSHLARIRAADAALFDHVSRGIRDMRLRGSRLRRLLMHFTEYPPNHAPARIMGHDHADALWAGVCKYDGARATDEELGAEMVHLEHTPVRVVLALLDRWPSNLAPSAGLMDVGCGLGQVTHLVAALTGRPVRGVDIEPTYVQHAIRMAGRLGFANVVLKAQDARQADYRRDGIVFMFTPFVGSVLAAVLERMREHIAGRTVYVASYGPSSVALARTSWLEPVSGTVVDPFRLCIFRAK